MLFKNSLCLVRKKSFLNTRYMQEKSKWQNLLQGHWNVVWWEVSLPVTFSLTVFSPPRILPLPNGLTKVYIKSFCASPTSFLMNHDSESLKEEDIHKRELHFFVTRENHLSLKELIRCKKQTINLCPSLFLMCVYFELNFFQRIFM